MAAYLDLDAFKVLSELPDERVDECEDRYPGFVDAELASWSAWIDARLKKLYATPFAAPYPVIVTSWLARIVTPRVHRKVGVDATDQQYVDMRDESKAAQTEVLEAASNAENAFDLPLRADTTTSGLKRSGTRVASQASPYVGFDEQVVRARDEDRNGRGTTRG